MTTNENRGGTRRRTVGAAALGYLGVSWGILEVVGVVADLVTLPEWVGPSVIVLLLIGFVMVLGTAWVQADPHTTQREEAGEVPTDWEVAPRDALGALTKGRLPHLTWGRTLVGGAVALSLLFGVAGAYVVFTQGWSSGSGEAFTAASSELGDRIAVLPFTVSGSGLEVYEEGMVELLSTNLDGLGGISAIDSRTVLARWDEIVRQGNRPDLNTSLQAAAATGASHAMLGSVVEAGGQLRLTAQIYDLVTGEQMSEVREEGSPDEVLALVDRLSVGAVREIIGSEEALSETGIRLASLTTSSIPALERYLEAESLYRRGEFTEALRLLEEALQADPEFGLAVMRRAQALGWFSTTSPDSLEAARQAVRLVLDRLAPRDAIIAEAGIVDFADRDPTGVEMLRDFVRRYPDEAEGWYQLSDFLYHLNMVRGGGRDEILDGFDRAVELGPRFAPYYIHASGAALMRADRSRFAMLEERYRALGGEPGRLREWGVAAAVVFGNDAELLEEVAAADPSTLQQALLPIHANSNRPQALADAVERYVEPSPVAVRVLLRAGRWSEVGRFLTPDPSLPLSGVEAWLGAFELGPEEVGFPDALVPEGPSGWSIAEADAPAALESLLAARDDGTGADPLLLAHLAERTGDLELAASLFEEESWRYHGPAATYRLARLRERQGQNEVALAYYRDFLESWSGADEGLQPMIEARAAVARLGG